MARLRPIDYYVKAVKERNKEALAKAVGLDRVNDVIDLNFDNLTKEGHPGHNLLLDLIIHRENKIKKERR